VLSDTHCHLNFEKFDPDRPAVLERARQTGVGRILIPGTDLTSSRAAVELTVCHPEIYAAVGIHPTEVPNIESHKSDIRRSTVDILREFAQSAKVKAIGEIGLDYYWDTAPHNLQQSLLKEQLALAAGLDLPVVIHFREKGDALDGDCAEDLMKILEQWVAGLKRNPKHAEGSGKIPLSERPGVLHSFSGSRQTAEQAIRLNFFIGVTGPVTYRKDRQELVGGLPLERLLIETDSPFLSPHPHRGRRNEPAYVRLIAEKIAALHGLSTAEVAAATTENASKLFCW